MAAKDLVEYVARSLVDDPSAVKVEVIREPEGTVIGYWLAEPFWGRGIATEALVAATDYAITTHKLTRIYALPFAWNAASCRVLEKAGYTLEGRLRRSAIKNGVITDQMQYAFIVAERAGIIGDDPPPRGNRG